MRRKIKLFGYLKSNEKKYEFSTIGQINNEIILYQDNDVNFKFDIENDIMKRIHNDYELEFVFVKNSKTINQLRLKELNQTIDMDLYTIDIVKKDNYYFVSYELNNDELFEFELNYE